MKRMTIKINKMMVTISKYMMKKILLMKAKSKIRILSKKSKSHLMEMKVVYKI